MKFFCWILSFLSYQIVRERDPLIQSQMLTRQTNLQRITVPHADGLLTNPELLTACMDISAGVIFL